jgi:hypothetical protein
MSFEEKIALAVHDFDAVAHRGIPPLRYTDGPNGIRGPDNVTAFPASLALAATLTSDWPPPTAARSPRRRATWHRHLLTAARPSRWRLSTPLRIQREDHNDRRGSQPSHGWSQDLVPSKAPGPTSACHDRRQ